MSSHYHGPLDIAGLLRRIRRTVRNDDDMVLAITGKTGKGKSSLALLIAQALQDTPLSIDNQFFWRPEGVIQAARELPEFSVIVLDEAVSANKRKSMHGSNIDLMEHLNICRTFHHCVIFAIPDFEDLDSSIRKRCSWVLECDRRGHFVAKEIAHVKNGSAAPVQRFGDTFPDPAIKYPALWDEYITAKKAYSHRGDDPKKPIRDAFIQQCENRILNLVRFNGDQVLTDAAIKKRRKKVEEREATA